MPVGRRTDRVRRFPHHAEVHSTDVFADDTEQQELNARKDAQRGGEEREARRALAGDHEPTEHPREEHDAERGGCQAEQARDPQWEGAETGEDVEGEAHQAAHAVVGSASLTWSLRASARPAASRPPREPDVAV